MFIEKRWASFILVLFFLLAFCPPQISHADGTTNIGVARLAPLEYVAGPWIGREKPDIAERKGATDLGVARLARAEYNPGAGISQAPRVLAARRTIGCGGVEIDEAVFIDLKHRVRQRLDAWKGPWHRNECLAAAGD